MRKFAHRIIVAGLLTALSGDILLALDQETLQLGSTAVSVWSPIGAGLAMAGVGGLLLMLRSMVTRRRRRFIYSRYSDWSTSHPTNPDH